MASEWKNRAVSVRVAALAVKVKLVGSDLLVVAFDLLGFWRCEHNLWRCVGFQ